MFISRGAIMKIKFYTHLMLLVGALMLSTPLFSHQLDHDAHTSSGAFWHNIMHTLQSCVANFSSGYLMMLFALISILAFIAYKVKWARRV